MVVEDHIAGWVSDLISGARSAPRGCRGRRCTRAPRPQESVRCGRNRARWQGQGGVFFAEPVLSAGIEPGLPRPKIVRSKLTICPQPFCVCSERRVRAAAEGGCGWQASSSWPGGAPPPPQNGGGEEEFGPRLASRKAPKVRKGIRPDLYLRPTSATALPPRPPAARGGLQAAQGEVDPELGRPTPASAARPPTCRSTFRDEIS